MDPVRKRKRNRADDDLLVREWVSVHGDQGNTVAVSRSGPITLTSAFRIWVGDVRVVGEVAVIMGMWLVAFYPSSSCVLWSPSQEGFQFITSVVMSSNCFCIAREILLEETCAQMCQISGEFWVGCLFMNSSKLQYFFLCRQPWWANNVIKIAAQKVWFCWREFGF